MKALACSDSNGDEGVVKRVGNLLGLVNGFVVVDDFCWSFLLFGFGGEDFVENLEGLFSVVFCFVELLVIVVLLCFADGVLEFVACFFVSKALDFVWKVRRACVAW